MRKKSEEIMTKTEAMREVLALSYGTLATLIGFSKYTELDIVFQKVIESIEQTDVSGCKNWVDVWNLCYKPSFKECVNPLI